MGQTIALTVLGFFILFLVWEYAPPVWGGLMLIALVLVLTAKALKWAKQSGSSSTF